MELISTVQSSLDNALEEYNVRKAKPNMPGFNPLDTTIQNALIGTRKMILSTHFETNSKDLLDNELHLLFSDSVSSSEIMILESDSIQFDHVKELAMKIMVSIDRDSLDLQTIHKILTDDFSHKDWDFPFKLVLHSNDSLFADELTTSSIHYGAQELSADFLTVSAHSPFISGHTELIIQFSNTSKLLFRKTILGISLSLILSVTMMCALVFLLRIIKKQKQLAEIKNDLISNLTHEFKTPITTISTALQALENFKVQKHSEKNQKYINISKVQLKKLDVMVEKILETATLDSDLITIHYESISIKELLEQLVSKYKLGNNNHLISLNINPGISLIKVDPFHFENVVSNLIDNAIKYGGNEIDISVSKAQNKIEINIHDNGVGISTTNQSHVFDRFYRISQGNIHDVKGFGIGLYYCKKIIEKHNGQIQLSSSPGSTTFKILIDA